MKTVLQGETLPVLQNPLIHTACNRYSNWLRVSCTVLGLIYTRYFLQVCMILGLFSNKFCRKNRTRLGKSQVQTGPLDQWP